MTSFCECCEFVAQNHSNYLRHLGTKKHAKRYLEAIENWENPNQNLVFSQVPKENVQETQNTKSTKKGGKRVQKEKIEESVQEIVHDNTQNPHFGENVQEMTDFVFLDTHFLDLYKSLYIPLNPTFLWIMRVCFSITSFFRLFSKKMDETDLYGNE